MLIAGDIGGTKTALALFSKEAGPHSPVAEAQFHCAEYPSLQAIVKEFLARSKRRVHRAYFAVAGPVIGGRVKTTNLPWVIEETALAQALKLNPNSVHLINDLEAIAWAVPILRPIDVQTINPGEIVRNSAIGVIAPGTGLGESSVTIIQHALDSGSPSKLCAATIDLFVSILASEAANLAVKVLATRGVYRPVELVCTCWPLSRNPPLCSPSNVKGDLLN